MELFHKELTELELSPPLGAGRRVTCMALNTGCQHGPAGCPWFGHCPVLEQKQLGMLLHRIIAHVVVVVVSFRPLFPYRSSFFVCV